MDIHGFLCADESSRTQTSTYGNDQGAQADQKRTGPRYCTRGRSALTRQLMQLDVQATSQEQGISQNAWHAPAGSLVPLLPFSGKWVATEVGFAVQTAIRSP